MFLRIFIKVKKNCLNATILIEYTFLGKVKFVNISFKVIDTK